MARPDQEKCRICAKLTPQEAQKRHGIEGDGCWNPLVCYNRRSYYRHRGIRNQGRKLRRREARAGVLAGGTVVLELLAPAIPAAVVHWYRVTKDAPLHAIGAELWLGNDRTARIEPVHCLGLTESQVKALLIQILALFSQQCGRKVERFRTSVELHPDYCPLRPCPLHPEGLGP